MDIETVGRAGLIGRRGYRRLGYDMFGVEFSTAHRCGGYGNDRRDTGLGIAMTGF